MTLVTPLFPKWASGKQRKGEEAANGSPGAFHVEQGTGSSTVNGGDLNIKPVSAPMNIGICTHPLHIPLTGESSGNAVLDFTGTGGRTEKK